MPPNSAAEVNYTRSDLKRAWFRDQSGVFMGLAKLLVGYWEGRLMLDLRLNERRLLKEVSFGYLKLVRARVLVPSTKVFSPINLSSSFAVLAGDNERSSEPISAQ
jgi:hypothetical protein